MAFPLVPIKNGSAPAIVADAQLRTHWQLAQRVPENVWLAFQYNSRLGPLLVHVNDHLDRKLALAEAANVVHMERTSFSKFFRRATGITYREFLRSIRIGRAAGLLLSCDASITDVAFKVGYTDVSLFGKHFKSLTGHSPREYRRRSSNPATAALEAFSTAQPTTSQA